jgi:hypothetical protein
LQDGFADGRACTSYCSKATGNLRQMVFLLLESHKSEISGGIANFLPTSLVAENLDFPRTCSGKVGNFGVRSDDHAVGRFSSRSWCGGGLLHGRSEADPRRERRLPSVGSAFEALEGHSSSSVAGWDDASVSTKASKQCRHQSRSAPA